MHAAAWRYMAGSIRTRAGHLVGFADVIIPQSNAFRVGSDLQALLKKISPNPGASTSC